MLHGKIKRTGTVCKALAPRRRCAGRGANPQRSRGTPKRSQRSAGGGHPLCDPLEARLDMLFEA